MGNLDTYAGCVVEFKGSDSRMIKGKKYNVIRDTICFDADGERFWSDNGDSDVPKENRYLTVVDERNNIRDFEIKNFL